MVFGGRGHNNDPWMLDQFKNSGLKYCIVTRVQYLVINDKLRLCQAILSGLIEHLIEVQQDLQDRTEYEGTGQIVCLISSIQDPDRRPRPKMRY